MPHNLTQISVAVALLIVLMFLNGLGLLSSLIDGGRLSIGGLNEPAVFILERVRDFGKAFFSVRELVGQNEILTKQIEALTAELAQTEKTSQENKVLREALGFLSKSNFDLVAAEVISYDYLNFDQKAVLNRGGEHGLKTGDNVIAAGGILVGILTDVSSRTSQMELITSSNMVVNVRTADGSAAGIMKGEHGLGLLFDQVSRSEVLKAGDNVITSGLGGKFAGNLFVGKIAEIRGGSSELFKSASVIPATDFRTMQAVFVIKSQ